MASTTSIVIFGASGDLTRRKLIPALFNLYCKNRMPENWRIVGVSRSKMSDEAFRERLKAGVEEFTPEKFLESEWEKFAPRIGYQSGDLGKLDDFQELDQRLAKEERSETGTVDRLYYLAIAPKLYPTAIINLGAANMVDERDGWRRVVIEKPFGRDLQSAKALNETVHQVLDERQIYRIDHYLGKETVQNILVFRFANSLFEPVWNRNYIDHVQITAAETVDVGHRAEYYDGVGVIRDMVQNHMLQLLSLVAIEPPASFEADALRNEKVKLFSSIRPIDPDEVNKHTVRAQYRGYSQSTGVSADSQTATFAAIQFYIDNWRWQGVPFYLRSGKALASKATSISIFFKRPPHLMFPMPANAQLSANELSICIQPDEGIHFSFQAKVPDTPAEMRSVDMSFNYQESFGEQRIPEAYERLLLDSLKGDASLFTRGDAIELAWGLVDNISSGWEKSSRSTLYAYEPGSWGPKEADQLIAHDGFGWSLGCLTR
jgi:glucose-6-phosphate 1-dehydrogenase